MLMVLVIHFGIPIPILYAAAFQIPRICQVRAVYRAEIVC